MIEPELSVVVPVLDEEASLRALCAELVAVLDELVPEHELVFVDDGSRDASAAVLVELAREHARVRVYRFDKNHGLSSALHAGFHLARGRLIASLDADLQNDPRDLRLLLEAIAGGADMACGWRRAREDGFVKRASSRVANAWRNWRTGTSIHDVTCPLKAFRREVREVFYPFDGLHRFLPLLAALAGHRVVEVPVSHRRRLHGRSKHGVWNRLFKGLRDLRTVRWMQRTRMTYRVEPLGGYAER